MLDEGTSRELFQHGLCFDSAIFIVPKSTEFRTELQSDRAAASSSATRTRNTSRHLITATDRGAEAPLGQPPPGAHGLILVTTNLTGSAQLFTLTRFPYPAQLSSPGRPGGRLGEGSFAPSSREDARAAWVSGSGTSRGGSARTARTRAAHGAATRRERGCSLTAPLLTRTVQL